MYEYRIVITSVHDGDTFRGDVDLGFNVWIKDIPFRFNRINAPELIKSDPRGMASRDFVRALTPVGKLVYVRTQKDEQEKYGRWLADIYPEGLGGYCLNDLLVEKGFALYWDGHGPRPV